MKANKRANLEKAGWTIGDADEFLGLSAEESAYIEMKLALSASLREARKKSQLSQSALADLIASSQSRVAKMEAGDSSVSIDLLIHSLLSMGVSRKELADTIGQGT